MFRFPQEECREPAKALFTWNVVRSFLPDDRQAAQKVEELSARIRAEGERHFRKVLDLLQEDSKQAARQEFLTAITYQPKHGQALKYLKRILTEPDHFSYVTEKGDTLTEISKKIYKDPELAFLIAYLHDLSRDEELKPGVTLKIPFLRPELIARTAPPREKPKRASPLPGGGRGTLPEEGQIFSLRRFGEGDSRMGGNDPAKPGPSESAERPGPG